MNIGKSKVVMLRGRSDEEKLRGLRELAGKTREGAFRRRVCFQVASQQLLRQLQTQEMGDGVAERLEVHPFSFEELWAERMFVSLPGRRTVALPLDWMPVTWECERRVHLVLFGLNAMSEALIKTACMVCHYPNFVRDKRLKTCITVVDEGLKEGDNLLVRRYGTLMENCRWSFVDRHGCATEHLPVNGYLGGEFTDVEFRLVAAEAESVVVRVMLTDLARSEREMPTIVFAGEDGEANWDRATGLPTEYYVEGCGIPIYARMKSSAMLGSATMMPQYRNIRAFGMDDCEYDLSMPLTQMAIGVSYLYNNCAETGDVMCGEVDRRKAVELWNKASTLERFSSEANAMSIMTKLRSVCRDGACSVLTDIDVERLSEVEHNRWSVERLMAGVRPVTEEEQREIDADRSLKKSMKKRGAHYDLRPYEALKEDFGGRNVQLYDEVLVRGLGAIVRAFEKGDTGAEMIVVKREEEERGGRWRSVAKWAAVAVAVLVVAAFGRYLYMNVKLAAETESAVGNYVYLLQIDSIEVWHGSRGVEQVLHRTAVDKGVGTAFAVEGVGIVTARHCVEYWLYDCLSKIDSVEKWTAEMRMAAEVESFNDTTRGERKRMVAICTLVGRNGERMDRVVFDVDQSRDKVRRVGTEGAMWRYVVPVFKRDKDMMKSDFAVVRREGERGMKLGGGDVNGEVCILGYPNQKGERSMICEERRVHGCDEGAIWMSGKTSKGVSGGPVVKWGFFSGFEVVGIMSRNDETGGESSWATNINVIK